MALPEHLKRKQMDACSHKETLSQVRALRGNRPPIPQSRGPLAAGVKRQLMDAVSSVETVAQIGIVKLTGGIALYAARIREMDQGAKKQRTPSQRQPRRDDFGRENYG